LRIILLFLVIASFVSCKKAEDRTCWKSSGKTSEREVFVNDFSRLEVFEHLAVRLVKDTVCKAVIKGGEHLLKLIEITEKDDFLVLENKNRCRFLRYKNGQINIELHYKTLSEIYFRGTDSLISNDVLEFNQFKITLQDGAGSINLRVNGNSMNIENPHGWGDITLKGNLNSLRLDMDGNGFFNTRQLVVSDSINVLSKSSVISFLNAQTPKLKAEVSGSADIWCFGVPNILLKNEYGKGKLVFK
jgi:hypothetical protein